MDEFDALSELRTPYSAEAEQAVVGSMLIDARCINDVLSKTGVDDFYLSLNKDVFETISGMHSKSKTIDPVTVISEMKKNGTYREDTQSYLSELMQVTPTAAHVMKYVDILNSETMKRNLLEVATSATEKIHSGESPQNVCFYLQGETEKIADNQTRSGLITSLEACSDFYNYLDKIADGKKSPYVKSGYEQLDRIIKFMNSGLYILAARPGCGKTTIALQIADKIAKSGTPVLFETLEMSKEEISAKRVAAMAGMNYEKVLVGEVSGDDYKKISEACSELSKYPLTINKKPSATVDEIGFLARQVKDLGFIVIDYLGLIRNDTKGSLYEKITDTSKNLKRLARTLNVPILCLAQLNREVEGRNGAKPRISDLRDSGAIEQDADGIILLSRDMENAPESDTEAAELICTVGKNRHGRTGEMSFSFYLSSGRIFAIKEY